MPHVLIAGRLHPSGLALIGAAKGVTFDYVEATGAADYLPLIGAAEGLVIRTQPLTAEIVARASRLRVVSRHGVGYDSVDVGALSGRGIPLAIVGDVNARSVAEHAMALMLACAKDLAAMDAAVRIGPWARRDGYAGQELYGARLLILGYGRSGRLLARIAAGFEMQVEAYDPFVGAGGDGPARLVGDLGAALEAADFVSVHAPKGERPLLGAAEIAQMKRGAVLVNTARGGMVEEAALAAALREERIAAAGIDVFASEPPAVGDPLTTLERVVLTPHVAGLSREATERMAVVSVRNVLDFFAGRLDPDLVVNRDALAGAER
ncbi:MAG: 3-phosphoglycerate dehydrogenase [Rhodobacteraceae bacterium]|nr:3-phosphoglycerate dehydrogenase [Paracoccaceae bacterium]